MVLLNIQYFCLLMRCRWYRAPELLLGPSYTAPSGKRMRARYGMAVDFWAIGCLFVRHPPCTAFPSNFVFCSSG